MGAVAGRVLPLYKGPYDPDEPYSILDQVYYNGSTYACKQSSTGNLPTDTTYWQIVAQGTATTSAGAFFGACDSLGNVSNKTVTIPNVDNFVLRKGVIVGVAFTNTNTYSATEGNPVSLNVNGSGSYPIYFDGSSNPLGDSKIAFGEADYVNYYQFDGSNYVFIGRSGIQTAADTPFDNTESGLTSTDAEGAINEVAAKADDLDEALTQGIATLTGNPLSFTTDSEEVADETVVTYNVTQSGSGDPSPSNERPFVGQDALEIAVPRKNLFEVKEPSSVNRVSYSISGNNITLTNTNSGNGHRATWIVLVNEGETYTLSAKVTAKSETNLDAKLRLASGDSYEDVSITELNTVGSVSLTIPAGKTKLEVLLYPQYTASGSGQYATFSDIQVEKGETRTAYEPYNPITDINIELDSTLYGGTWEIEKGLLTITHARVDMGSLTWTFRSSNGNTMRAGISGMKSGEMTDLSKFKCDIYKTELPPSGWDSMANLTILRSGGNAYVKDTNYGASDVSAFTAAVTGHFIVYELATPIVLHLTSHEVELLNGANVVASNGSSISLSYRKGAFAHLSDLIPFAEGINELADLVETKAEKSTISNKDVHGTTNTTGAQIAQNTIFYLNGTLCKALSNIATNAAFTLNTNYKETTIGEEITAILNSL